MVREGHTNFILLADNYKVGHHLQYSNTTNLHSYFESRGGKFDRTGTGQTGGRILIIKVHGGRY